MDITHQELLEAMHEATLGTSSDDGNAKTIPEIQDLTGWGANKTRVAIKKLIAGGTAECVKIRRMNMTGGTSIVPAYRLVQKSQPAN